MPRYFVSQYLAPESSTIYVLDEDGSCRSVAPQGEEHRSAGPLPDGLKELDEREALRLTEARSAFLREHEVERVYVFDEPIRLGPEEAHWDCEEKDYERRC